MCQCAVQWTGDQQIAVVCWFFKTEKLMVSSSEFILVTLERWLIGRWPRVERDKLYNSGYMHMQLSSCRDYVEILNKLLLWYFCHRKWKKNASQRCLEQRTTSVFVQSPPLCHVWRWHPTSPPYCKNEHTFLRLPTCTYVNLTLTWDRGWLHKGCSFS